MQSEGLLPGPPIGRIEWLEPQNGSGTDMLVAWTRAQRVGHCTCNRRAFA